MSNVDSSRKADRNIVGKGGIQLRTHTLSQWWLASPLFGGGIAVDGLNSLTNSQKNFLDTVIHASGKAGAPTRSLAVAAVTPRRKKKYPNIGLGLSPIRRGLSDGSATSHIQEIARQKSNITRRNLAVGIAIVNEAERSVAAALMYHCDLIEDTEEYVKTFERASDSSGSSSSDDDDNVMDELPKPPELLVRLWKNARRSRKWLKEQKDK